MDKKNKLAIEKPLVSVVNYLAREFPAIQPSEVSQKLAGQIVASSGDVQKALNLLQQAGAIVSAEQRVAITDLLNLIKSY